MSAKEMSKVWLKPGKDDAVKRYHPWVFSGAIGRKSGTLVNGEFVEVCNTEGEFLAVGQYQDTSIAVRIVSYKPGKPDIIFWKNKLRAAYELRERLGLTDNPSTTAYRLLHGEGDDMPGLIIDIYGSVAVFQAHTPGMHAAGKDIAKALMQFYKGRITGVYDKSTAALHNAEGVKDAWLAGEGPDEIIIKENDIQFAIDFVHGQKTGFFIDQRDNRDLLRRYAAGKTVLNAFCYSGGFSAYALQAGATKVDSIDASAKAMVLTDRNIALNDLQGQGTHQSHTADVQEFLKASEELYDVMVLDPPAFAKSINRRHNAVQGYKRLNAEGMKKIKPGGILFTFSCSQVVDRELFYHTIAAAGLEAGRKVRVLHYLSQPADHPVSLYHPEGSYLKGLVVQVI